MLRVLETLVPAALALGLALAPAAADAGDAAAGKTKYEQICLMCHGATGKGDGPTGATLQPPPRDFSAGDFKLDTDGDGKAGTDADLANVIKNGAAQYGGSPLMTPWGAALTEDDVANLVAYIRSLKQ